MFKAIVVAVIGAAASITVATSAGAAMPQATIKEQANIPSRSGVDRTVAVLKSGKKLETVTCGDFGLLDESFRPQAVVYGANYGPKGKAHPTVTVDGVERIVPVVVGECRARPGDHFVTAVNRALKASR